jgi:hypothetical protein
MHRMLSLIIIAVATGLAGTGCTTIHSVGGGPKDGEFYFAAQRTFLGIPGPTYVARCEEIKDPLGVELHCHRVLVGAEAGQLAPGASPSGRQAFVRSKRE